MTNFQLNNCEFDNDELPGRARWRGGMSAVRRRRLPAVLVRIRDELRVRDRRGLGRGRNMRARVDVRRDILVSRTLELERRRRRRRVLKNGIFYNFWETTRNKLK